MPFSRASLRTLRPKIEAALQALAEAEKISIELGSARFNDSTCTFKLELTEVNPDGTVTSKIAQDFKHYCVRYGLTPEAIGQTFTFQGTVYTIKGCKPRSTKYPIIGENNNGKTYKFMPADVRRTIDAQFVADGAGAATPSIADW
tara:strand:+ start:664 stop:1098 length:435 start_codon:yes stop_codon:yes gene_type:complete